jgi:3-deoxy-D-manno-octulosonate 8-phosphate phosphatase (KDO 8-P phosphatase)
MHRIGFAVAVANAKDEVKRSAHWTTTSSGGHGAVRDVVELMLKAQGRWDEILRHYELAGP